MKKWLICLALFLLFPLFALAGGCDMARQVEQILIQTYGFTEEEASRFAIAIKKEDGKYSARAIHPHEAA